VDVLGVGLLLVVGELLAHGRHHLVRRTGELDRLLRRELRRQQLALLLERAETGAGVGGGHVAGDVCVDVGAWWWLRKEGEKEGRMAVRRGCRGGALNCSVARNTVATATDTPPCIFSGLAGLVFELALHRYR